MWSQRFAPCLPSLSCCSNWKQGQLKFYGLRPVLANNHSGDSVLIGQLFFPRTPLPLPFAVKIISAEDTSRLANHHQHTIPSSSLQENVWRHLMAEVVYCTVDHRPSPVILLSKGEKINKRAARRPCSPRTAASKNTAGKREQQMEQMHYAVEAVSKNVE